LGGESSFESEDSVCPIGVDDSVELILLSKLMLVDELSLSLELDDSESLEYSNCTTKLKLLKPMDSGSR